jgi:hypothetical protein
VWAIIQGEAEDNYIWKLWLIFGKRSKSSCVNRSRGGEVWDRDKWDRDNWECTIS